MAAAAIVCRRTRNCRTKVNCGYECGMDCNIIENREDSAAKEGNDLISGDMILLMAVHAQNG